MCTSHVVDSKTLNWCFVAGCRRRLLRFGPKWRAIVYEQDVSLLCILASTIESLKSEEQFGFHDRRIVARPKVYIIL